MGGSSRYPRNHPHCGFIEDRDWAEKKNVKTKKWIVHSTQSGAFLGKIKWHGAWRKYVIQYEDGTIMDNGCHLEVNNFIDEQMGLRQKELKKKKEAKK